MSNNPENDSNSAPIKRRQDLDATLTQSMSEEVEHSSGAERPSPTKPQNALLMTRPSSEVLPRSSAHQSLGGNYHRPGRDLVRSRASLSEDVFRLQNDGSVPQDEHEGLEHDSYFKSAFRRIRNMEDSLDVLQVQLLERHAVILRLRMTIIESMMDFEATSKVIKAERLTRQDGHMDERLNSSLPEIPQLEHSNSGSMTPLHLSWNSPETTSKAILLSGEERLQLEIHTILEELPGESSEPSTPKKMDETWSSRSSTSSSLSPAITRGKASARTSIQEVGTNAEPNLGRVGFPSCPPFDFSNVLPVEASTRGCEQPSKTSAEHSYMLDAAETSISDWKGGFSTTHVRPAPFPVRTTSTVVDEALGYIATTTRTASPNTLDLLDDHSL